MNYILYFAASFVLATVLTPLVKRLAFAANALDIPNEKRKIHAKPMPLLGGFIVYFAYILILGVYLLTGKANFEVVPLKFFLSTVLGGAILMVGGFIDDKFQLPPKILWLFPALASLVVIFSGVGVGIKSLSNPFGSPLSLDFKLIGIPFSGIFIWIWCMGMIFTTKFLDGLDGLCSGISLIAGLSLFSLSLLPHINQPETATIAIIFSGAIGGFLVYGFNPASIFLGESGSTFLGFQLAVISVILGGKIATALLVMGIPIMDVAWVITRRLWYRQSPFKADRQHLHFRLLDIGLSQRQSVGVLYAISAIFGFTAVFLQSLGKLIALLFLFALMVILALTVVMIYKRKHPHIPEGRVDEMA